MNKNKIFTTIVISILITLSLASINTNAEIIQLEFDQCPDISGNWTLNHYDWQGNLTSTESVSIIVNELNVTIYAGTELLTKGTIRGICHCNECIYEIECSDFRGLGVNYIHIINESFMITNMPMCESCNPSEFVRGNFTLGVNVTCNEKDKSVYLNQTAEYEIVIKNTGNIKDTYEIGIPHPLPLCCFWISLSPSQVTLEPNQTITVILGITPYQDIAVGQNHVSVNATSTMDKNLSEGITTITTAMLDITPPNVSITRPIKALYVFGNQIRKFLIRKPLIIGDLRLWADIEDNQSGIKLIEIYIDDDLKASLPFWPKSGWIWSKPSSMKHRHTIKIVVHDVSGNNASAKIDVLRFL